MSYAEISSEITNLAKEYGGLLLVDSMNEVGKDDVFVGYLFSIMHDCAEAELLEHCDMSQEDFEARCFVSLSNVKKYLADCARRSK